MDHMVLGFSKTKKNFNLGENGAESPASEVLSSNCVQCFPQIRKLYVGGGGGNAGKLNAAEQIRWVV